MTSVVITGTQWGDEGKGKIVDSLTAHADVIVRFQGGNNAGHTLVIGDDELVLHLVPSGICHPGKICVIGNGVVLDPGVLIEELEEVRAHGHLADPTQLRISTRAHVILSYHKRIDLAREEHLGARKIGTTGRGIGPAYEDKVARRGVRVWDLMQPDRFRARLEEVMPERNLYIERVLGGEPVSIDEVFEAGLMHADVLRPHVTETSELVANALEAGQNVLFEGAQGSLLDVDHGTYPFVTSSNTVAGMACVGSGIGPTSIHDVLGISKAYTTRVGSGPFPTELKDAIGTQLRDQGGEYGATTGRERRCGWFDTVVLRHARRTNGLTGLILTKLDVLSGIERLQLCVGYRIDGVEVTETVPPAADADRAEPIYEEMEGWTEPLDGISDMEKLPEAARRYVRRIEELVGVEIVMLSVGRRRDELITLRNPFT